MNKKTITLEDKVNMLGTLLFEFIEASIPTEREIKKDKELDKKLKKLIEESKIRLSKLQKDVDKHVRDVKGGK